MFSGINIAEEPRGETYLALLRFASLHCKQFSLVWRDQLRFDSSAQDIADELEPHLVAHVHTDTWPGTRLLGHMAMVRYYRLNAHSMQTLQAVGGLYSWLTPAFPEDIAFYSSEQSLWLGTISHENDAWFQVESLSWAEIIKNVPGIVLSP